MEDKDFSTVALYGSGYVGSQCVGLHGARSCRADVGDGDGTWNDVIYGDFLVGSVGDGCPFRDLEGFGKSLDKYDSGHSLHGSQHLSPN